MSRKSIAADVAAELARIDDLFPAQNHPDYTPVHNTFPLLSGASSATAKWIVETKAKNFENSGPVSWLDILLEEVAEARDEAVRGEERALRAELVQVAAVAQAWIADLDRRD